MRNNLKVQQILFGEKGLTLVIKRTSNAECFFYPVVDLFHNDSLLTEFSFFDVRLITYFAAEEEQKSDRAFLKKKKKKVEI